MKKANIMTKQLQFILKPKTGWYSKVILNIIAWYSLTYTIVMTLTAYVFMIIL